MILAVERSAFGSPWGQANILTELENDLSLNFIALSMNKRKALGYICARVIDREGEILRIAVIPEARRMGVGLELLQKIVKTLVQRKVATLYLEVAENNTAALILYKANDFLEYGFRPGYYDAGKTGAKLLRKELS